MDNFVVILSPRATKDMDNLSDATCERIASALKTLAQNPFPRGSVIKEIKGTSGDFYRLRMDKYRAFYVVESGKVAILRVLGKKDAERYIRKLN